MQESAGRFRRIVIGFVFSIGMGGAAVWWLRPLWQAISPTGLRMAAILLGYGLVTWLTAWVCRLPVIWRLIAMSVLPAWGGWLLWPLPPVWFLAVALGLALVFGQTFRGRVPLFLSAPAVCDALLTLLPTGSGTVKFAEMGCGTGTVLLAVGKAHPQWSCFGMDAAWVATRIARWRCRKASNITVACADFWDVDWQAFDVIYVFLSPLVMPAVWEKACASLRPGSMLISNSFEIPGVPATRTIETGHPLQTRLFLWQL